MCEACLRTLFLPQRQKAFFFAPLLPPSSRIPRATEVSCSDKRARRIPIFQIGRNAPQLQNQRPTTEGADGLPPLLAPFLSEKGE